MNEVEQTPVVPHESTLGPDVRPRQSVLAGALAWSPLAAAAVYLWVAGGYGLPRAAAGRILLALVLTQVIPGLLVWRIMRPPKGWWIEDVVMGFGLGLVLAMAAQAVAGWTGWSWVGITNGPALAVVLLAVPQTRHRIVRAQTSPLHWSWGPAVAAASLLLVRPTEVFYRHVPLEYPGFMSPYHDMPFHLSLATELAHRGPANFPYVLGEPLTYHWFSHAWVAQVAGAAGVDLDIVLYRIMPTAVSVGLVTIVAVAATRISGRALAGPVAATLAATAGILSLSRGTVGIGLVKHLSPSLALASILAVALLVVLACRWHGHHLPGSTVLVAVLAIASSGTKGSALPVVIGGVALATAIGWAARWPARRRILHDLLVLVGSFGVSFVALFGGSTQETNIDPVSSLERVVAVRFLFADGGGPVVAAGALLLLLLGVLALGGGALIGVLALDRLRTDPVVPLLMGTGLAGAVALGVLSHQGGSQSYFLRNAVPALAIASGYGIAMLWDHVLGRRWRVLALAGLAASVWLLVVHHLLLPAAVDGLSPDVHAAASLLSLMVIVGTASTLARRFVPPEGDRAAAATAGLAICLIVAVPLVPGLLRAPLPDPAEVVPPDERDAFSGDQIEAARWLRDHSTDDDVVATNRHCADPRAESCDSRRFFVAAYTERQVLVEGWAYTPRAVRLAVEHDVADSAVPYWRPDILELNDGFLTSPTREEARLLWQLGVRWLFIDRVVDHAEDFGPLARLRHETEYAMVYELMPPVDVQEGT